MVEIQKNINSDTRSAKGIISFEEFQKANDLHISEVSQVMFYLSKMIIKRGKEHDNTKKKHEILYYQDFIDTMKKKKNFIDGSWYNMHVSEERHHINTKCPEDINLIDVLEMIIDCICAGKSRTGEVYPITIDRDKLYEAFENTIKLIDGMIIVKDDNE